MTSPSYDSTTLQSYFFITVVGLGLLGLFIMDMIGIQTRLLDRLTRFTTLAFALLGLASVVCILIFGWNDLNPQNWGVLLPTLTLFCSYAGLGWYFIRADRGIVLKNERPYFEFTVYALFFCGVGFLMELLIPRGLLIGIGVSFLIFIIIMRYELVPVKPKFKERKLIKPFKRVTWWNFVIDMVKLVAVIVTILALSYNGTYVLFPRGPNVAPNQWIINLAFVGLSGALAMFIFNKIKTKFFGLIVILAMFVVSLIETALLLWLPHTPFEIFAVCNGITLVGLYYFIEQKMDVSTNVRSMAGSFYILVFMLFLFAIVLRVEPGLSRIFDILTPLVSLLGIFYITGYVRDRPAVSHVVDWEPVIKKENR